MTTIYVKDKSFVGSGYTFATYSDIVDLSKLPSIFTVGEWSSKAEIKVNAAYWIRCLTPTEYIYIKCRTAYVDNDRIGIEYKIDSKETVANKNINTEINGKSYVFDYSIPHLNSENYYIEHAVTMNGKEILNYALEWNTEKKHSAWVAFSFDEITNGDVTGRTDAWDVDPQLSIEMQTSNEQHKSDGFDRGHICASEDRVYSVTANKQTFYYSNISPQFNSFNGGYWAAFEYRVRRWARYSFDKLYVTKGGSLNNLLINYTGNNKGQDGILPTTDEKGLTIHGVACPKYYYMAILAEKDGNYQALGFWIEHRDDYGYDYNDAVPSDVLQNHVISIDQLEQNTGIDFFCNLPDEIEDDVEAGYTLSDWSW
ncbi:MAG: DNA/RNA non-specific endonuclease [Bacteroides sp.]|nr:DNA/RNA non-specific endonuclease [Bacteroides sp.]